MAFTYSGDPSDSDLDYLRFVLGDTKASSVLFQDAELMYIINTTKDTQRLAVAFRHAATCYALVVAKRSLGPQSEDSTARINYYTMMAERYEKLSSYSGVPALPTYEVEAIFGKDMMSNV